MHGADITLLRLAGAHIPSLIRECRHVVLDGTYIDTYIGHYMVTQSFYHTLLTHTLTYHLLATGCS